MSDTPARVSSRSANSSQAGVRYWSGPLLGDPVESQDAAVVGHRLGDGLPIAEFPPSLHDTQAMPFGDLRDDALPSRGEGPPVEIGPVRCVRADGERVVEERQRLLRARPATPRAPPRRGARSGPGPRAHRPPDPRLA